MGLFDKKSKHSIGETIAELRKSKGLTQLELAEKLNISDKAVSKWEKDKSNPSLEDIVTLSKLFDVTTDYIITGQETKKEVITISKLELCAKNDDVKLFNELNSSIDDILKYKDENGLDLFTYIFKHKSKDIFSTLLKNNKLDSCLSNYFREFVGETDTDFFENFYFMRILCNDTSVIRDLVRLEYINSNINNHLNTYEKAIGYNGSQLVRIPRKIISDRIIDLIIYNKQTEASIKNSLISYNKEQANGFYSPALSYSYVIDYVVRKKDFKLATQLLKNAIDMNEQSKSLMSSGGYKGFVDIPKETFLTLLENEQYELIDLANKTNLVIKELFYNNDLYKNDAFILSDYEIESNKIKHNTKLSSKEKSLLCCIHSGIVCLDELIALNDFDLYEKTLKKYPVSKYETIFDYIHKKDYKMVIEFISKSEKTFSSVKLIEDFQKRKEENIEKDFETFVRGQKLNEELNASYLNKFIYSESFGVNSPFKTKSREEQINASPSYQNFIKAKNYIVLNSVLDKDIKFIEKACKTATQQELNNALIKIKPDNFKGINILLNYGAKVQKKYIEDDGWGKREHLEDDEIATAVLSQQIKNLIGEK